MGNSRVFPSVALTVLFNLPQLILLFFAWANWIASRHPELSPRRLLLTKAALIIAPISIALQIPGEVYYLSTMAPPDRFFAAMNVTGLLLWFLTLIAACFGKKWTRVLLIFWSAAACLPFFGIFMQVP